MQTEKTIEIADGAKALKIENEPIGRLKSYENNAKIHTAEQVEQIKASINEFGFNDPIAVWTNEDGKSEIVEGHGRLMAALELNMDTVPVIHLDHLTDDQRRAYTHVHNQLTMNTGWDFETLETELEELDFDFNQFGFEGIETDIDSLFETYESPSNEKEPKVLRCPHCGEDIEL